MKIRNRLLRINSDLLEGKKWQRLTHVLVPEECYEPLEETMKYVLEQKMETPKPEANVKFNKLVEIIELKNHKQKVMTKADELSSIALDLKKE